MQRDRALALSDIVREVFERSSVAAVQLPPAMRVYLTRKLAEIE